MINLKQMREKAKDHVDLFYVDILERANAQIEDLLEQDAYCDKIMLTAAYNLMEEEQLYQYSKDYVKAQMAGYNDMDCRLLAFTNFIVNYNVSVPENAKGYFAFVSMANFAERLKLKLKICDNSIWAINSALNHMSKKDAEAEDILAAEYGIDCDYGDGLPVDERGFDD